MIGVQPAPDREAMLDDYSQRFGGVARLYGRVGLERLRAAHVAVLGLGGVGSWAVEALARSGIGALTLIDLDDVCITNVNRQLPALDGQIGRPKVEALAERVRLIHPGCTLQCWLKFYTPATAERLLAPSYDFVIDAIDRVSTKAHLLAACQQRRQAVLTCGGAGGRRDGTAVRVADLAHTVQDELLRQLRRELRRDYGFPRDRTRDFGLPCIYSSERLLYPQADGTCALVPEPGEPRRLDCGNGLGAAAHVTAAFGLAAAGEVIRRIALALPPGVAGG